MLSKKQKRRLPFMCMDEHISSSVTAVFKEDFRIVQAARQVRLRGREELSYLPELYSQNAVFVTSDAVFIQRVHDQHIRHAGIIYLPNEMTHSEQALVAEIASGFVKGACSSSPLAFRNRTLFPGHDGLRSVSPRAGNVLEFSWDWLADRLG